MLLVKHVMPILLIAVLVGACATISQEPVTSFTTITLEKPVYFMAPDGTDVVVSAGKYDIQSAEQSRLLLVPAEGVPDKKPLLVQAHPLPHEEALASGVALAIPQGDDEQHVVLLLPDGKGFDAGGTYSGVRSRAARPIQPVTSSVLKQYAATLPQFTVMPSSVFGGNGCTATGTVRLGFAAPAGGMVMKLSSSQPAAAQVPQSVLIPGGSAGRSFTISTQPVPASVAVVITAGTRGFSRTASLTIQPVPANLPPLMRPPCSTALFDQSGQSSR
jgi:hypothetical protein